MPGAVDFRDDRWACSAARISSVSMNKSVQEQVPDGLGLADVGLVRWVSEAFVGFQRYDDQLDHRVERPARSD
jgi:hypothetical protein